MEVVEEVIGVQQWTQCLEIIVDPRIWTDCRGFDQTLEVGVEGLEIEFEIFEIGADLVNVLSLV